MLHPYTVRLQPTARVLAKNQNKLSHVQIFMGNPMITTKATQSQSHSASLTHMIAKKKKKYLGSLVSEGTWRKMFVSFIK